ncbi:protein transport protein YIF1 [Nematocida sp. LUAm3]|nr:protein transport protein YIF1 [Nematocida sp. LUAm3]
MNNPLRTGIQQQAFQLGNEYISKTVSMGKLDRVKKYFQIDNGYLFRKILLIFYPYRRIDWNGRTDRDTVNIPIYYPDMYIPLMAFVTYIVLTAGELEIKNKFKPEILTKLISRSLVMDILEGVLIIGLEFFFDARELKILDTFSFLGYKYVPLVVSKISFILFGALIRKLLWLFLLVSFLFFLGKGLKCFLITENDLIERKKRKMYFLFIFVAMDLFVMLLLK